MARLALIAFASLAGSAAAGPVGAGPVDRLIERERAFAEAALKKGMRDSFLEFISDDGIIFVPRPVAGRRLLADGPQIPGRLEWAPSFAGLAASGDLGFTTGPYSMTTGKHVSSGQYLTIWRKAPDGSWRFVLDRGTPGPAAAIEPRGRVASLERGDARRPRIADGVMAAEQRLSVGSASAAADALRPLLAPTARLLREGSAPASTLAARTALLQQEPARIVYHVLGSGTSAGGDLAYAYGEASWEKDGAPVTGHFVRMWQRQPAGWRIVVDSRASDPRRAL